VEGDVDSIPEQYRTCLYRIVQEALTNCARHAEASQVVVKLRADETRVWVSIEDDGKGFDPRSPGTRGLGLIGMEERARELKGALQIRSQMGHGATIRVELPVGMEAIVGKDSRSAGR
jgi:signal transduction histidine kinase